MCSLDFRFRALLKCTFFVPNAMVTLWMASKILFSVIFSHFFLSFHFNAFYFWETIVKSQPALAQALTSYLIVCFSFFRFTTNDSRTVDRLWSITEDLNILYKENWTRLAAQEVQQFQVSETNAKNIKMSVIKQPWPDPMLIKWNWVD